MLVFALDLENVEEIGACGVDFDEVFVWCWGGGGQVGYFEVEGALYVSKISRCSTGYVSEWWMRVYTLTYSLSWMARIVYISSGRLQYSICILKS